MTNNLYVQYGCGLSCPDQWINFDASPTLRLQKIPLLGSVIRSVSSTKFPTRIKYGDIVKGINIKDNSCAGLYCSHILEHLSYNDLMVSLKNSYKMLKPGGTFRMVLPDMERYCRDYISALDSGQPDACNTLMDETLLGVKQRNRGFLQFIKGYMGNSKHLWMWDYSSLSNALAEVGFTRIRRCEFNDSADKKFELVEAKGRFDGCLAIECSKN